LKQRYFEERTWNEGRTEIKDREKREIIEIKDREKEGE
jgi:hypothetical protein